MRILPPRSLYHPVLPARIDEKLLFALCYTCAVQKNTKWSADADRVEHLCTHSVEDRALTGVWATPEIQKAVEKGYTLMDVYEIHTFEESNVGLFSGYVNTFLKAKQEASGLPRPEMTSDDIDKYIHDYHQKEGILLEKDEIGPHPGRRATAKICLNSLWGKFGQRSNLKQTKYISRPSKLFEILFNPNLIISSLTHINVDQTRSHFGPASSSSSSLSSSSSTEGEYKTSLIRCVKCR